MVMLSRGRMIWLLVPPVSWIGDTQQGNNEKERQLAEEGGREWARIRVKRHTTRKKACAGIFKQSWGLGTE
jgi:hypothetical protein